eukprot:2876331-Rhodomonas_salina.2
MACISVVTSVLGKNTNTRVTGKLIVKKKKSFPGGRDLYQKRPLTGFVLDGTSRNSTSVASFWGSKVGVQRGSEIKCAPLDTECSIASQTQYAYQQKVEPPRVLDNWNYHSRYAPSRSCVWGQ